MANSDCYNQQVGKTSTDACSLTHTRARWRLYRKHTCVPRSEVSLPKPTQKMAMEDNRGEELGSSPAALRSLRCEIPSSLLSLSFIAQGGRPLSPPLHRINSVLSDRDTLGFFPPY